MKAKWLFGAALGLLLIGAIYVGTAIVSLRGLSQDATTGNTASLMQRIDVARLRTSLADQILRTYYRGIEQHRAIKTVERVLAPTVVDSILSALLTPENITIALQRGSIATLQRRPITIPALSKANVDSVGATLSRIRLKSPVQLQVLLDEAGQTAIRLHYKGTHWKLSGLDLPPAALERLTASLPAR